MKLHNLLWLVLLILYPGTGCIKNCDTPTGGYLFVLPHTVSPAQSVYKVGDTISVSADFSHHVMESRGEYFLLEDFSFQLIFALFDLMDSNPSTAVGAFSTCEIMLEEDTNLLIDHIGPFGEYNYSEGRYRLGFKFRPLKPGFYALVQESLTNSGSYAGIQKDFPGKCGSRTLARAFVDVNNSASNNYHLLEDDHAEVLTFPWRQNQQEFYRDGVYLFYVEE